MKDAILSFLFSIGILVIAVITASFIITITCLVICYLIETPDNIIKYIESFMGLY